MRKMLFTFLLPTLIFAQNLTQQEVKKTFGEILSFHVEHDQLTPLLLQRALKIYIEQFDGAKMYLLDQEAKVFASLSQKKLEKQVNRYQKGDLQGFEEVNGVIVKAIKRAQKWRQELQKEMILSFSDLRPSRGESYLSFAKNEQQLRNRMEKQLAQILLKEQTFNELDDWTPEDREKIFRLWERRYLSKEEPYLALENEHSFALHTLRALSKSLDAHTAYFSEAEARVMRASLEKQFEGIGVILREGINGVTITGTVADGPAHKSGQVLPGDQILAINGQKTETMQYSEVLEALKGERDSTITLTLRGKGEKATRTVTLKRQRMDMAEERVQHRTEPCGDGKIAILALPSFYESGSLSSAEKDLREALIDVKKEGNLKGVILDMRENAGGFLTQAVKVTSLFITRGVVVISKYSKGEVRYLRNLDGRLYFNGPMIVLTSKASASAAEIVAGALQDYGAALVVGDEHTYGKGTIQYQTVTDRDATSFYKVTVGRYYTVSGRSTQIKGVEADLVVPSIFSSYKLGERFLEYPLEGDEVAAAYIDPLTDVDYRSRMWFQKNYLPNLQRPQDCWRKALPILRANSKERLANNPNFAKFIEVQDSQKGRSIRRFKRDENPPWGQEDLQMAEAINIMKDMIAYEL